jgi:4'-phosphopantetheinyl transferase
MMRIEQIPGCGRVYAAADAVATMRTEPPLAADMRSAARLTPWRIPEHLAVRTLLRRLLGEVADASVAGSPLAARPSGQPFLAERPEIGVSLSHTDGWVAAAVHLCGAVGVDVQAPVSPGERLAQRCCTPSARQALSRLPKPDRDTEFAWIWSVQEACVKAAGLGVAGLPWTISVEVGQRTGRWRDVRWRALRHSWPVPVSCAHGPASEDGRPCGD